MLLKFALSLALVALGQPARIGWAGALAAIFGFALFFASLPASLSSKRRFWVGMLWFASVQLIQLSWMTTIEFQGYYILFVYAFVCFGLGCQFGLLTMFVSPKDALPVRHILFCSALWTLMEWVRLHPLCGFSWNPIGLSLTHFVPSLQLASVFGILGLSFWVMFTNLLGLNAIRDRFRLKTLALWALCAGFPYLFGIAYLEVHRDHAFSSLRTALLQTAWLPSEKVFYQERKDDYVSPFEQWWRILETFKKSQGSDWELIVLPEAAIPLSAATTYYPFEDVRWIWTSHFGEMAVEHFPPLKPPYAEERILRGKPILCVSNLFWCQTLCNLFGAELIVGLDHLDRETGKNYNSAFFFQPGRILWERYDKRVLLPLAESLPLESLRPLSKYYGINDFFFPGEKASIWKGIVPISASICYDETFAEGMREGRKLGAQLFVNITNDNFFPASSLHRQHLYHSRIRAVENGVPLLRACNAGVSAAIDSFGRIHGQIEESATREGLLSCTIPAVSLSTLFVFWGEGGIIGICLAIFLFQLYRKFNYLI